jgi:hypothetical protein
MGAELLDKLDQIIGLEEKFLPKFAAGTSQHSLLQNRIQALRTARELGVEDCRATAIPRC